MFKSLVLIAALIAATPALAEDGPIGCGGGEGGGGFEGGGGGEGPCPGGPDSKPPLPTTISVDGEFSYQPTSGYGYGAISNYYGQLLGYGDPHYFLYGPDDTKTHFGANGVTLGGAQTGVSFAINAVGDPNLFSVSASAFNFNNYQSVAYAGIGFNYLMKVSAADLTEAAKIDAVIAGYNSPVKASGKLIASLSGVGEAMASVQTGIGLPGATFSRASIRCTETGGCGTMTYSLGLSLVRGDAFEGGSALDYYGNFRLFAYTYGSERLDPDGIYGNGFSGSAYADPTISFNQAFKNINFTAQVGGQSLAVAFVPEPAQWALMIGGFGLIGGAMRRRRVALAA